MDLDCGMILAQSRTIPMASLLNNGENSRILKVNNDLHHERRKQVRNILLCRPFPDTVVLAKFCSHLPLDTDIATQTAQHEGILYILFLVHPAIAVQHIRYVHDLREGHS